MSGQDRSWTVDRATATIQPIVRQEVIRPRVKGKFIYAGDEKLYVCGVTYGPFRPEEDGSEYHTPEIVERDFAQMRAHNINVVRTYTVPPCWLLDAARRHGLYVMVGLPWEQHTTFLDDRRRIRAIEEGVRKGVRACADHPAVLCYAIGNEIPASIIRWYGRRRVERFLKRLFYAAKAEDPGGLVTYVNFPTTEYLQLPFVDFVCFNVYLESQTSFQAYLARLQNIAGDRPLVMTEIGLDSRRNGKDVQAHTLDWQIRTAFAAGCTGVTLFSWTDEWYRGGYEIEDWDFGLVDRRRCPKPALASVREAFAEVPFPPGLPWPHISVVVCSYNGAATIRECLEALQQVKYSNFEVIVVDDGSTDATAAIASEFDVRLIRTENRGLSAARSTGMQAARGEIVAYIDDDAYPDPHWLTYLAASFSNTRHVMMGGPNISPPDDGRVADCVARAPGNPIHVLLSDEEAEHIPGCNMAIRREALKAVGGLDPTFRIAGDDIDLGWRLQQRGGTLGFSPSAMVWHHRRNTIRAYWRQQKNYGRAEALLERKWPEKYNRLGHLRWEGRVYENGHTHFLPFHRWRIYYGMWGSGLFQSIYKPAPGVLQSFPLMPEYYLIGAFLFGFSLLGAFWTPLLLAFPLLALAIGVPLAHAAVQAARAVSANRSQGLASRLKSGMLVAFLFLLQPLARLVGRLSHGRFRPWPREASGFAFPYPRTAAKWSEQWQAPATWLARLEANLRARKAVVQRGGNFERWDLEVRSGSFASARVLMAVEEHGAGKQLVRFRLWPYVPPAGLAGAVLLVTLSALAAFDEAWVAVSFLGAATLLLLLRGLVDCARAMATALQALEEVG